MTETWNVLRDTDGLNHLVNDAGGPACGYPGDVDRRDHPADHAAMWCSACLQNARFATRG